MKAITPDMTALNSPVSAAWRQTPVAESAVSAAAVATTTDVNADVIVAAAETPAQGAAPRAASDAAAATVAPAAAPAVQVAATPAAVENKAAVVLPASDNGNKDEKVAAVAPAKDDDDDRGGLLWGLLGLGALLAGAGGSSSNVVGNQDTGPVEILAGGDTGSVTEAGGFQNNIAASPPAQGDLQATVDAWEAVTQEGTYGTFTMDTEGKWTYTLFDSPEVEELTKDDAKIETFDVKTADGQTTTVTITVNGADDLNGGVLVTEQGTEVKYVNGKDVYRNSDTAMDITSVNFVDGGEYDIVGSLTFDGGITLNLVEPPADLVTNSNLVNFLADSQFMVILGGYDTETGRFDVQTPQDDIIVLWNPANGANQQYGVVMEDVVASAETPVTFTIEGQTFTFDGGAITYPVIAA